MNTSRSLIAAAVLTGGLAASASADITFGISISSGCGFFDPWPRYTCAPYGYSPHAWYRPYYSYGAFRPSWYWGGYPYCSGTWYPSYGCDSPVVIAPAPIYYGPGWSTAYDCAPSYYGSSFCDDGVSLGIGYSSWGGWSFGFGFSSGFGYSCYRPSFIVYHWPNHHWRRGHDGHCDGRDGHGGHDGRWDGDRAGGSPGSGAVAAGMVGPTRDAGKPLTANMPGAGGVPMGKPAFKPSVDSAPLSSGPTTFAAKPGAAAPVATLGKPAFRAPVESKPVTMMVTDAKPVTAFNPPGVRPKDPAQPSTATASNPGAFKPSAPTAFAAKPSAPRNGAIDGLPAPARKPVESSFTPYTAKPAPAPSAEAKPPAAAPFVAAKPGAATYDAKPSRSGFIPMPQNTSPAAQPYVKPAAPQQQQFNPYSSAPGSYSKPSAPAAQPYVKPQAPQQQQFNPYSSAPGSYAKPSAPAAQPYVKPQAPQQQFNPNAGKPAPSAPMYRPPAAAPAPRMSAPAPSAKPSGPGPTFGGKRDKN